MVLLLMLLLHFFTDFTLQGILIDLKQRVWWEKQVPDLANTKYKRDYLCALLCHSLYWAIAVFLPLKLFGVGDISIAIAILINTAIHFIIDNEKANRLSINLWQDQTLHFLQIIFTFLLFIFVI